MLKPPPIRPWTCARCIRHEHRRRLATAATSATTSSSTSAPPPLASHRDPQTSHQDAILRQIFDSQPFWKDFSARQTHPSRNSVGLFQNRYLTRPEGFEHFASITLAKCKRIVTKVLAYNTTEQYKSIAKDLDRLSDLLCRVIDLCDFVRSTHPDRNIQAAATQAYAQMFEYMNVLNTTTGLNDQLKAALALPEVTASWSEEELTVANILARDFAKSAIDLSDTDRQAFVELSNEIAEIGPEFVDQMVPQTPLLKLPSSKLKGMDPLVVRQLTRWGSVSLPTIGMPASLALRTVEDADTRREIYMANRTSAKANIERLEHLLHRRAELARLSGHDSFAHMALSDKMAKSPEAVVKFLDALAADNAPRVQSEMQELLEMKKCDARSGNFPDNLNAWDRDYYQHQLLQSMRSKTRTPDVLSAYFSLGTVMQGLSRLFHRLYGIRLVPKEAAPGETWNNDVRRLDVIDDREGHVAVIYCDLFERAGKSPNPAHFTLRCSRRILPDELEEAEALRNATGGLFESAQEAATDGLAANRSRRDNDELYQLPTIALICDFAIPAGNATKRPALLTFREVQTLFHEMGHALHSICGRTALQNVSGTRCATDFAELPSVLMEHFASAPEVLDLYARHWETDKPLDTSRVAERVNLDTYSQGSETEAQLLLAMLDQTYHSNLPLSPGFDSTRTYQDVWGKYSSLPEPAGTSWQGFFGHLFGYGATYYSYLFDRAIAGKIWKDVFKRSELGAVDPGAGERFRDEVLRHGGGRDGWNCVAGVLRDESGKLAEGGEEAMGMVGQWGVKD
ncbi:zincin [Aureobasidium pullulans]|uniref:Mitochondrial intermediate peptidase n=1 Tax=Aureobasidium pullulans TaxID=5580 RepID=A0A4S9U8Y7_AURPU|nr:zincin [Aureobasidium pullulans]THZ33788.1 zincin [Aureobasidium pullulans]